MTTGYTYTVQFTSGGLVQATPPPEPAVPMLHKAIGETPATKTSDRPDILFRLISAIADHAAKPIGIEARPALKAIWDARRELEQMLPASRRLTTLSATSLFLHI
jgi:hypothetical protein